MVEPPGFTGTPGAAVPRPATAASPRGGADVNGRQRRVGAPDLELSVDALDSAVLGRSLRYRLALPTHPGTEPRDGELPLVLLLHGSGGDELAWDPGLVALRDAIARADLPPVAAVAPGSGTSWWVDGREAVETAVLDELLPTIIERHGVGASALFVAGFSMGGFGAVRFALKHPGRIDGAIALSASVYDGLPPTASSARNSGAFGAPFDARRWRAANYPALLPSYRDGEHRVPIYLAAGDDDWNEPEGWRFNVEFQTVVLYERLRKVVGSPARLKIDAGGHDWDFWRPEFLHGLRYLLSSASHADSPHGGAAQPD